MMRKFLVLGPQSRIFGAQAGDLGLELPHMHYAGIHYYLLRPHGLKAQQ
jgi:hypothetical protein